MDKFKAAMDQIKKLASDKNSHQFMQAFISNKQNFDILQSKWFHSPPVSRELEPLSKEETLQQIFSYVDLAISMYLDAVVHTSLTKIVLLFSKIWEDGVEPRIYIESNSSAWTIVIDDLWESNLKLNRSMKQECVSLSEVAWYEYRSTVDIDQLQQDAEWVCALLQQKYPSTEVSFLISDAS